MGGFVGLELGVAFWAFRAVEHVRNNDRLAAREGGNVFAHSLAFFSLSLFLSPSPSFSVLPCLHVRLCVASKGVGIAMNRVSGERV